MLWLKRERDPDHYDVAWLQSIAIKRLPKPEIPDSWFMNQFNKWQGGRSDDHKIYGPVGFGEFPRTYIIQDDSTIGTVEQIFKTSGLPQLFDVLEGARCLSRAAKVVSEHRGCSLWHVRCIFGPKPVVEPLCKNCEHWGEKLKESRPPKYTQTETHLGLCGVALDASPLYGHELFNLPADRAVSCDCEGYESRLYTGPEFGCIHFEEFKT